LGSDVIKTDGLVSEEQEREGAAEGDRQTEACVQVAEVVDEPPAGDFSVRGPLEPSGTGA
jgi:hypothetical protein